MQRSPLPEPPRALQALGLVVLLVVLAVCAWVDYKTFQANTSLGLLAITIGTPTILELTRRATLAMLVRYAVKHR